MNLILNAYKMMQGENIDFTDCASIRLKVQGHSPVDIKVAFSNDYLRKSNIESVRIYTDIIKNIACLHRHVITHDLNKCFGTSFLSEKSKLNGYSFPHGIVPVNEDDICIRVENEMHISPNDSFAIETNISESTLSKFV